MIWWEGAIFIVGFAQGLTASVRLIPVGGYLVVFEFCWFCSDPPAELWEMFLDDTNVVGDVAAGRKTIADCGYRLLADFALPDAGWCRLLLKTQPNRRCQMRSGGWIRLGQRTQ